MDENKLDFFGDIKDKLVLIAVGLLSMATLVPLFINNVHKIFHVSIGFSYGVFTVCYFILPLVFFSTYYFFVNEGADMQDLKKQSRNKIILGGIILFCAILFYFIYPGIAFFSTATTFWIGYTMVINLLIVAALVAILWRANREGIRRIKVSPDSNDPGNTKQKKILFTEFCIIGGCILFLFLFLYLSNLSQIKKWLYSPDSNKKARVSFVYYEYAKDLDTITIKFKDLENICYENVVIANLKPCNARQQKPCDVKAEGKPNTKPPCCDSDSLKYTPKEIKREDAIFNRLIALKKDTMSDRYKKEILVPGLRQDTTFEPLIARLRMLDDSIAYSALLKLNIDSILKFKLKNAVRHDSGADITRSYSLYRQSYYMTDYARNINDEKREIVKDKWVVLLKQLKYKGLQWMLLLIMLSLYWWLHLSYRLVDQKGAKAATEEINRTSQSISQVKSFIYVLLLLVLPFFKHIEKDDVDLDRPFLNFGVASLTMPENGPSAGSKSNDDLQKEGNTLLKSIDKNINDIRMSLDSGGSSAKLDSLNNQINDVAHQVIGSQKRLKDFDKKHPHLPQNSSK